MGCGRNIDPEFMPYVERFMKDGGLTAITSIQIEFGNAEGAVARCSKTFSGPIIRVQRSAWGFVGNELGESGREQFLYHELGHCVLGRDHVDGHVDDGHAMVPKSIMYHNPAIPHDVYQKHRARLIKELFGR